MCKKLKMEIVICGSMTLARKMLEIERELINQGHNVILPAFTEEYSEEEIHNESAKNKIKHDLIRNYFEKIKQGDAVLIVNERRNGIDNYIGGNSFLEMGFAHILNKAIYLLNPIPQMTYRDEIIAMQPIILNNNLLNV